MINDVSVDFEPQKSYEHDKS